MKTEYCPHCRAKNMRVRSELTLHGHVVPDDYCGICGHNWPRPTPERETEKVTAIEDYRGESDR